MQWQQGLTENVIKKNYQKLSIMNQSLDNMKCETVYDN